MNVLLLREVQCSNEGGMLLMLSDEINVTLPFKYPPSSIISLQHLIWPFTSAVFNSVSVSVTSMSPSKNPAMVREAAFMFA